MSGIADRADPAAGAAYRDALVFACAAAAKQQITIVIEPINGRDMPETFSRALQKLASFDSLR